MDLINLIITLVSGAIGGNLAGAGMSQKNMGALGNTIAGLIGGGAGDFLFRALGLLGTAATTATAANATSGGLDIGQLLASVGVSGVSGAVITAVISMIKAAMDKK